MIKVIIHKLNRLMNDRIPSHLESLSALLSFSETVSAKRTKLIVQNVELLHVPVPGVSIYNFEIMFSTQNATHTIEFVYMLPPWMEEELWAIYSALAEHISFRKTRRIIIASK